MFIEPDNKDVSGLAHGDAAVRAGRQRPVQRPHRRRRRSHLTARVDGQ